MMYLLYEWLYSFLTSPMIQIFLYLLRCWVSGVECSYELSDVSGSWQLVAQLGFNGGIQKSYHLGLSFSPWRK